MFSSAGSRPGRRILASAIGLGIGERANQATGGSADILVKKSLGDARVEISNQAATGDVRAFMQVRNNTGKVWEFSANCSGRAGNLFGVARASIVELISSTDTLIGPVTSNFMLFGTNNTEAFRIDSSQLTIFQKDRGIRLNNQTSGAGASSGTLTNAPAAGNPGHWLKINVGGTNYCIPCWAG